MNAARWKCAVSGYRIRYDGEDIIIDNYFCNRFLPPTQTFQLKSNLLAASMAHLPYVLIDSNSSIIRLKFMFCRVRPRRRFNFNKQLCIFIKKKFSWCFERYRFSLFIVYLIIYWHKINGTDRTAPCFISFFSPCGMCWNQIHYVLNVGKCEIWPDSDVHHLLFNEHNE